MYYDKKSTGKVRGRKLSSSQSVKGCSVCGSALPKKLEVSYSFYKLKALNLTREGININLVAINGFRYRLLVVIVNLDRHFNLFPTLRIIWQNG